MELWFCLSLSGLLPQSSLDIHPNCISSAWPFTQTLLRPCRQAETFPVSVRLKDGTSVESEASSWCGGRIMTQRSHLCLQEERGEVANMYMGVTYLLCFCPTLSTTTEFVFVSALLSILSLEPGTLDTYLLNKCQ